MSEPSPDAVLLEVLKTLGTVQAEISTMVKRDERSHKTSREIREDLYAIRTQVDALASLVAPLSDVAEDAVAAQTQATTQRAETVKTITETITGNNRLGTVLMSLLTGLVVWYLNSLGVTP